MKAVNGDRASINASFDNPYFGCWGLAMVPTGILNRSAGGAGVLVVPLFALVVENGRCHYLTAAVADV